MKHPSSLRHAALWIALSSIYPLTAHSAAGVAQFAVGDVSVRRGAAALPLAKGQAIESGDNIVTGASGLAQLRFSDGGLVSLAPNSQFNIERYADENDADRDSFAVRFLRGGMRAITGLIGKRNHANYRVQTATATIGIRGSAFSSTYNEDGSLNVAGEQDGIVVCTNAGCVDLIVGEVVRVTSNDSLPSRTSARSNVPPLVARQDLFVPEVLEPIKLVPLPDAETPPASEVPVQLGGVSAMFAFGTGGVDGLPTGGTGPSNGVGTFFRGQLLEHTGTSGGGSTMVQKTGTGEGSFGTAGTLEDPAFIGWGYWDEGSQTLAGQSALGYRGVHYIVGRPTTEAQMPRTGTATYVLLGGTAPTAYDSATGTLRTGTLLGAGLNVDFGASRLDGYVNTSFTVNGQSVAVNLYGLAYLYGTGSAFYGTADGFTAQSGYFNGFFIGDGAARAGLVYGINNPLVGDVRGSAAFTRSGTGKAYTEVSGMGALFMSADGLLADAYYPRGGDDPSTGVGYFVGTALYRHDATGMFYADSQSGLYQALATDDTYSVYNRGPTTVFGSAGNLGDADFAGWGYWTQAVSTYDGSSLIAGVHHVVGRPTPASGVPITGTATYTLEGGTAPTAFKDGTLRTGQLLAAGLNVDFSAQAVYAYVQTRFDMGNGLQLAVDVSGVGYLFYNSSTFSNTGGTYAGGPGRYNGYFIGPGAQRAGLLYQVENDTIGLVSGAAVFKANGTGETIHDGLAVAGMFASDDGFIFDSAPRGGEDVYTGSSLFVGSKLLYHDDGQHYSGYSGVSTMVSAQSNVSSGSLGTPDSADFVGWGYWAKGNFRDHNTSGQAIAGVHYLVGRPTPSGQMPSSGTGSFNLAGGSLPTATQGSTTLTGSLLGGSLSADFSAQTFSASIQTQFMANGAVVPVTVSGSGSIQGSTMAGSAGDAMNGFFAGNGAYRAGLLYEKTGTPLGVVRGAAGFERTPPP